MQHKHKYRLSRLNELEEEAKELRRVSIERLSEQGESSTFVFGGVERRREQERRRSKRRWDDTDRSGKGSFSFERKNQRNL